MIKVPHEWSLRHRVLAARFSQLPPLADVRRTRSGWTEPVADSYPAKVRGGRAAISDDGDK